MTIINERWPQDLPPVSCAFGRSRNDQLQTSPRTRETTLIVQGRPLWQAELTWRLPNNNRLAKLRRYLDGLKGFQGSVQIWNFGSAFPYYIDEATASSPTAVSLDWTHSAQTLDWTYQTAPLHWRYDATVEGGAGAVGSTSIDVRNLEALKPVTIPGQYIQIGRRLYVADTEVTSDASGNATIELTTPLIEDISDGETVRLVEAACEMRLATQNFTESANSQDGFRTVSAPFIETVKDFA